MKEFALLLVSFLWWSWPLELCADKESQESNTGKVPATRSNNSEEQKKVGKDAAVQTHGKKKTSEKGKEDCGCETSLFGEPVTPPVQKPVQGRPNITAGKQSAKPKGRNSNGSLTASKPDVKEKAPQNSEKQPQALGDSNQSKNQTAQPLEK